MGYMGTEEKANMTYKSRERNVSATRSKLANLHGSDPELTQILALPLKQGRLATCR